jgi:amino acid permease
MLAKLIEKRNIIVAACAVVFLPLWGVALVCGNNDGKAIVLIGSLLLPPIVYALLRLAHHTVNATRPTAMRACIIAILIIGLLATAMMILEYVKGFPNGLTIGLGSGMAMIISALDAAKKYL